MIHYKNKLLEDILISGYIESRENNYFFKPMNWWVFLKLENNEIIEFYSDDGNIKIKNIEKIECYFDIEEEDMFCLSSFYSGDCGIIENVNYYSNSEGEIYKIEIKTTTINIVFDAVSSFSGFEIKIT